jgi:antirestriction protein ArdC
MSTTTKPAITTAAKRDIYEEVTQRIVASLRAGVCPWKKDWTATNDTPRNWDGRPYRGLNWLLLGSLAYQRPVFVTFNKARELGGQVRKGEKGHLVTFWKFFKGKDIDPTTGKHKVVPMLRHYYVFNIAQCEGLPELPAPAARPFQPVEECERIVASMPNAPTIREDGRGRCFYRPSTDSVHMTERTAFKSTEGFYSTLFHELAHATGHASRLDRATLTQCANFGSETYSREELVAELTAANLCAHTGISAPVIENQASYIQGWLSALQEDAKALVWAAGKAARAADYILGIIHDDDATTEEAVTAA